jgi:hypothetical protein
MSRYKLVFLSLFAAVALSAGASASASALEFYNGNGELIEGSLTIVGLGGLQRFGGEVAGVKIEVICLHAQSTASVHNGLGAGGMLMGLGLALLLFSNCALHSAKPKTIEGCEVAGSALHFVVKLLAVTLNGEPYLEATPDEGTSFEKVDLINCKNAGLNGEYELTGLLMGKVNNATQELVFKSGEGELTFAGNPATDEGSGTGEMEGGGRVEVK